MKRKSWCDRGTITNKDKTAIRAMIEIDRNLALVLLYGAVPVKLLGELSVSRALAFNGYFKTPMFSVTIAGALLMDRFEAKRLWPVLGAARLADAVSSYTAWLGLEPCRTVPTQFDFWRWVLERNSLHGCTVDSMGATTAYWDTFMQDSTLHVGAMPPWHFFSAYGGQLRTVMMRATLPTIR